LRRPRREGDKSAKDCEEGEKLLHVRRGSSA
jgi:hypothetical protein